MILISCCCHENVVETSSTANVTPQAYQVLWTLVIRRPDGVTALKLPDDRATRQPTSPNQAHDTLQSCVSQSSSAQVAPLFAAACPTWKQRTSLSILHFDPASQSLTGFVLWKQIWRMRCPVPASQAFGATTLSAPSGRSHHGTPHMPAKGATPMQL